MTKPSHRAPPLSGALLALLSGCHDNHPPIDPTPSRGSGFALASSDSSGPADTTAAGTSEGLASTSQPQGETRGPWAGTASTDDIEALLTITFTPAHALSDDDTVGLAAGYRNAEVGWDGREDLFSPVAYQQAFPAPPEQADTLAAAEPVPVFDWGDDDDWITAGAAIRVSDGRGVLYACLLPQGNYPLYRSSAAMGVPDECAAEASAWSPAQAYDIELYGGESFQDNALQHSFTTPPALTVTAPDLDRFNADLPSDQALDITWQAGDDPLARIIIRLVDENTNVITVHAIDDGTFTIPAAELEALARGPIDLIITRERTDSVQFSSGTLTVLSRDEHWGFFNLF